jgi:hypothetical protein
MQVQTGIVKHCFFEEAHFVRTMAIHKPFIIAINVGHDVRICIHYAKQVAGNVAIQVMGKTRFPSESCTRAPLDVIM